MKKCQFFFLVLFSTLCAAKEADNSLLVEGKSWTMRTEAFQVINGEFVKSVHFKDYTLREDTLIDGVPFMRIYKKEWKEGEEAPAYWEKTNRFLGQEGDKVYYYNGDSQVNYLYMDLDFSRLPGDTIQVSTDDGSKLNYTVTCVSDTILLGSQDERVRKYMTLEYYDVEDPLYEGLELSPEDMRHDTWVEGIGSLGNGITGIIQNLLLGDSSEQLVKCCKDDSILYQRDYGSATAINTPKRKATTPCGMFNLKGQRLQNNPQRGLVILNGRKTLH